MAGITGLSHRRKLIASIIKILTVLPFAIRLRNEVCLQDRNQARSRQVRDKRSQTHLPVNVLK